MAYFEAERFHVVAAASCADCGDCGAWAAGLGGGTGEWDWAEVVILREFTGVSSSQNFEPSESG